MKTEEASAVITKEEKHHIPFGQMAAYGAGGIIPIALFNIAGILVGLMGNISLGLSAFWLGLILIVPRLWDALSDPIIGHLSDNTRTRWGRRRPYLLLGGILVAVFFVVMWWIPKGDMVRTWFPSESGYQAFQLVYILVTLLLFFTAVNIFEIPHGALGMELTNDYHERTRLFSAKSFVGNLFAMSTPWLFALANTERFQGYGRERSRWHAICLYTYCCHPHPAFFLVDCQAAGAGVCQSIKAGKDTLLDRHETHFQ